MTHLALVGPTASGKSVLALAAAHALDDVEIVSVDSMQVYRELDIGTAKPTARERAAIPHHLIDIADPSEDWSVARFQAAARGAVADIESRGKRAMLVGGTGLYLQAVIDPLSFPPEDLTVRSELEAEVATPEGLAVGVHRVGASRSRGGGADRAAQRAPDRARARSRQADGQALLVVRAGYPVVRRDRVPGVDRRLVDAE